MAIPASKVKAVCTDAEIALVRASRKGEIDQLSPQRIQQLAARTRKLLRKWQGLARGQARTRGRQAGHGEASANTKLKVEIFSEALEHFEMQLKKLGKSTAASAGKASRSRKKERSAEHRARRAAVRKGMTAATDLSNLPKSADARALAKSKRKPPAAEEPAIGASGLEEPAPAAAGGTPKPARSKPAVRASASRAATIDKSQQRQAASAAKQSRVARSGKTTRTLGHVQARTRRAQARRDSKG